MYFASHWHGIWFVGSRVFAIVRMLIAVRLAERMLTFGIRGGLLAARSAMRHPGDRLEPDIFRT